MEAQGLRGEWDAGYSEWQRLRPDSRPVSWIVTGSVQHLQLLPLSVYNDVEAGPRQTQGDQLEKPFSKYFI